MKKSTNKQQDQGRKISPEKSSSEEPAILTVLIYLELPTPFNSFPLPQQDTCCYAYVGKENKCSLYGREIQYLPNKDN